MIQNTARPRGRPRSFDETGALEKADSNVRVKGDHGVTIDYSAAGLGVGRPSLYAVFGDKRLYSCASLGRTRRGKALAPARRSSCRALFVTRSPPS